MDKKQEKLIAACFAYWVLCFNVLIFEVYLTSRVGPAIGLGMFYFGTIPFFILAGLVIAPSHD